MRKKLLLGTTNAEKVSILRSSLASLPIDLLNLADIDTAIDVIEDGKSPEENAEKKAKIYRVVSNIPTLAIDGGLFIDGLPPERQPGVLVRRVAGREDATEAEVLDFYEREIERLGGERKASWTAAMALAISTERIVKRVFLFEVIMRAGRKGRLMAGAPLNCLMLDPGTGRYYSEMEKDERPDFYEYRRFIEQYIDEL